MHGISRALLSYIRCCRVDYINMTRQVSISVRSVRASVVGNIANVVYGLILDRYMVLYVTLEDIPTHVLNIMLYKL